MKAVVAILGLDSHWRGAVLVARLLREQGVEVIYLGNQFPEELVATVLQEDAQLVALSRWTSSIFRRVTLPVPGSSLVVVVPKWP